MGDLAGLHSQARRLILALRRGIDRLEALESVRQTNFDIFTLCLLPYVEMVRIKRGCLLYM